MLKVLRWIGIVVGVLVGVVILAGFALNLAANAQFNRTYDIPAEAINIPEDEASLARGEYLAGAFCTECHGADLAGMLLFEEPGVATVYGSNLTPSDAGIGDFTDADYVRALRHGIRPDGTPYVLMPSEIIIYWSEEDLAATIAYLKTLPPDDNALPPVETTLMGRIMLATGALGEVFAASYIDHDMPFPNRPEIGVSAEYGAYLIGVMGCRSCHGTQMSGGPPPPCCPEYGEIPTALTAADWSAEAFVAALKTGVKPDGNQLDEARMPWTLYTKFHDEELEAIHQYLVTLAGS